MPMVQAFISDKVTTSVAAKGFPEKLGKACLEIVPAAFNSPEGPLTPGSIEFIPQAAHHASHLTVDVLLVIEAYNFPDRESDLDDRCKLVQKTLQELFRDYSFGVWGTLVCAGWATDHADVGFDGDMSMGAAFHRALKAIEPPKAPSAPPSQ